MREMQKKKKKIPKAFQLTPDATTLSIHKPKWNIFWFEVEEIDIKCGEILLKLPEFFDLDPIETLVFKFPKKTHVFKRVEEKEADE